MICFYKKQQANKNTGRDETMLFNVSTEQSHMQKSYPSPICYLMSDWPTKYKISYAFPSYIYSGRRRLKIG